MTQQLKDKLNITYVDINTLRQADYNPRKWSKEAIEGLTESIKRFGLVDPLLVNTAPGREGVVIGGHFRLAIAKELGMTEVPIVSLYIADLEKEKELNLRLNKNVGEFDWEILANFGEEFLATVGFNSEELDEIFNVETTPEVFDLEKELKKLNIEQVEVRKGDIYQLGDSKLMCGDSTVEAEVLKLYGNERADLILTDPPYRLQYLKAGKRHGNPTEGFGLKRNRKYLETDELPADFTEKWMANIAKVVKPDFQIICYENWKNIREIWNSMEAQGWKVKNMLVWHTPNRNQGFSGKYSFFSKHDIAVVGASEDLNFNFEEETGELQNEYETALYAIQGKPFWEGYGKGKKYCPTDFLEYNVADEKSSGQGIIFGIKPLEILIPYLKVLSKRDGLVGEPFGGSGSTLIAATKMHRRCFIMEKSPVYAEVIINRWEKLTGKKAVKITNG